MKVSNFEVLVIIFFKCLFIVIIQVLNSDTLNFIFIFNLFALFIIVLVVLYGLLIIIIMTPF